jgi:hypothetical protein
LGNEALDTNLQLKLQKIRALNPKVFTYRKLAEMFDISLGYVSKLLKTGDNENG